MRRRSRALPLLLVFVGVVGAVQAEAQGDGTEGLELVDRIVAVVDQAPILQSDIDQALDLGLVEVRDGEGPQALQRRVLDELIERHLRYQEVGRFGTRTVTVEEIEQAIEEIRSRAAEQGQDLAEVLESAHTSPAELRQIVARQLAVVDYVDRRLGTRVFISLEEIQSYYDDELVPALREQQAEVPPLEEVRETIREVLREQRLNEEIERWTEGLRREADIRILIDDYPEELPPLRERFEGAGDTGDAQSTEGSPR